MSIKTLSLADARKLYSSADAAGKALLETIYDKKDLTWFILNPDLTIEMICEEMGKDLSKELRYDNPTTNRQRFENAGVMLDIISEYLLQCVILDWANPSQKKWWPWFNSYTSGAGFRFRGSDHVWTLSFASGGARLAVDTKEKSDFFGSHPPFLKIWNDFNNPIK